VDDTNLRLRLYRRLANLGSMDQIGEIESELEDRFGPLPEPARNLMDQLRFKVMAREARVRRILVEEGQLTLYADWLRTAGRDAVQEQLGDLAHIGKQTAGFPLEEGWQEQLQLVLERMRQAQP